jgi:hypothetical protein
MSQDVKGLLRYCFSPLKGYFWTAPSLWAKPWSATVPFICNEEVVQAVAAEEQA